MLDSALTRDSPLRVLYTFPHAIGRPGIATTAHNQVVGLARQGVDVRLFVTSVQRELEVDVEATETLVRAGIRIPHRALGVQRAYAYHDRVVARALPALRDRIDIVHCWPSGCLRTLRAARALGIPTVREAPSAHTATAFDDAAAEAAAIEVALPEGHHHRFDASILARELDEFAATDCVLVPSEYVERTFLDRGFAADRLARHRYGYDPRQFAPAPHTDGDADQAGLTAIFVGRCEPNKGLHHALHAWLASGLGDSGRFVICGTFVPAYREYLREELAHPSVDVHGFVNDVAGLLRSSDVLLLPSVSEGSALVTYEAQASGCVPVVSDAAGAYLTHLEQGLVHRAGDVATLTEHLRLLDRDRPLLRKLREAAIEHSAELTWDAAAARLVEVYRERTAAHSHDPTGVQ